MALAQRLDVRKLYIMYATYVVGLAALCALVLLLVPVEQRNVFEFLLGFLSLPALLICVSAPYTLLEHQGRKTRGLFVIATTFACAILSFVFGALWGLGAFMLVAPVVAYAYTTALQRAHAG